MTTGKTIALNRWTFVDKVMSLLLNMLSRLVITFLPKSKRLLISWLQSAVILEPPKIKSDTVSTVSPSIVLLDRFNYYLTDRQGIFPDVFILFILNVSQLNHGRRQWQPNLVFLPGKSHGQKSLVGYSPKGH